MSAMAPWSETPAQASDPPPAGRFVLPCSASQTKCVSTASFNKPAQYTSPWVVPQGTTMSDAARQLTTALRDVGGEGTKVATLNIPEKGAVRVTASVPKGWGDDMRFSLRPDEEKQGAILCTFTVVGGSGAFNLPDPPACATEGCITGPPQRKYVDLIRDRLGWLPLETDEDKKWVQVMGPFLIDPDDYVSAFD